MKEAALLIIFALLFAVFLAYGDLTKTDFAEEDRSFQESEIPELTLNLSSDREIYHSSEEMQLEATIKAETNAENLTVKVYGIKDSAGRFRVKGERVVNVDPPGTTETFVFRMPSCYGCAGVSPGDYDITFEVLKDGEMIGNFSKLVKLER